MENLRLDKKQIQELLHDKSNPPREEDKQAANVTSPTIDELKALKKMHTPQQKLRNLIQELKEELDKQLKAKNLGALKSHSDTAEDAELFGSIDVSHYIQPTSAPTPVPAESTPDVKEPVIEESKSEVVTNTESKVTEVEPESTDATDSASTTNTEPEAAEVEPEATEATEAANAEPEAADAATNAEPEAIDTTDAKEINITDDEPTSEEINITDDESTPEENSTGTSTTDLQSAPPDDRSQVFDEIFEEFKSLKKQQVNTAKVKLEKESAPNQSQLTEHNDADSNIYSTADKAIDDFTQAIKQDNQELITDLIVEDSQQSISTTNLLNELTQAGDMLGEEEIVIKPIQMVTQTATAKPVKPTVPTKSEPEATAEQTPAPEPTAQPTVPAKSEPEATAEHIPITEPEEPAPTSVPEPTVQPTKEPAPVQEYDLKDFLTTEELTELSKPVHNTDEYYDTEQYSVPRPPVQVPRNFKMTKITKTTSYQDLGYFVATTIGVKNIEGIDMIVVNAERHIKYKKEKSMKILFNPDHQSNNNAQIEKLEDFIDNLHIVGDNLMVIIDTLSDLGVNLFRVERYFLDIQTISNRLKTITNFLHKFTIAELCHMYNINTEKYYNNITPGLISEVYSALIKDILEN